METSREFELRLFDAKDDLVLIAPLIVGSEAEARAKAASLVAREGAARFSLTAQMRSRLYRGGR